MMVYLKIHLYHEVQPYNITNIAIAWKESHFILSKRSYIHMVFNLNIAVHVFPMGMLTSVSVDEILLPRYVKWSTNFRG